MEPSIIHPFKSDAGPRLAAFNYALRYSLARWPDAEHIVVEQDTTTTVPVGVTRLAVAPGTPFNRSLCANAGVAAATKANYLIVDSDILPDPAVVAAQLALLADDQNARTVFVPMSFQYALDAAASNALYEANEPDLLNIASILTGGRIRNIQSNGGAQLGRKAFFDTVKFDETYVGWGKETADFFNRVRAAGGGRGFAAQGTRCIHLFHPQAMARA